MFTLGFKINYSILKKLINYSSKNAYLNITLIYCVVLFLIEFLYIIDL